jgi:hypothetical protein
VGRVLLTGISVTGKSSILGDVVARGSKVIDTEDGWRQATPANRQLFLLFEEREQLRPSTPRRPLVAPLVRPASMAVAITLANVAIRARA